MARTADDCALILSVIAGHDPKDPHSLFAGQPFRYEKPERPPKQPLRVGRLTNVWNKPDPEAQSAVSDGLKILEAGGAKMSETAIPDGPFEQVAELTILMEAASSFQDLIQSGRCSLLQDPLGQINGYASEQFTVTDYLQAQRVRAVLQGRMKKLFDSFDVLVAEGQSGPAELLASAPPALPEKNAPVPPVEAHAPDGISSLCGLPALTLPCGFNSKGLPLGMQFIARAGDDLGVISAAHLFKRKQTGTGNTRRGRLTNARTFTYGRSRHP